jgi:3-dehydroquinate dehydratase type I
MGMNRQMRNICLALPVKTGKIDQVQDMISEVVAEEPNVIEFRFDYIDDVSKINPSYLESILKLTDIPAIFTLRSSQEGGHLDLADSERLPLLKKLVNAEPQYIDVELRSPSSLLREVFSLCKRKKVDLILSNHNFESTESLEDAYDLVENCKKRVNSLMESGGDFHTSFIFKLVFTATQFEDNLIPLKLCKTLSKEDQKIISFCMGELGLFSRIMCVKAGASFTYAAFHETTAPGQLGIKIMKEIYDLL